MCEVSRLLMDFLLVTTQLQQCKNKICPLLSFPSFDLKAAHYYSLSGSHS